jgi:riboflavin synthase
MFTGIVTGLGQVIAVQATGDDCRLRIRAPEGLLTDAVAGDSISVSGVCLTALEPSADGFSADVSLETLSRTTLGALEVGDTVNLEPALRLSDRLGGHLVSGHVDAHVRLLSRQALGRSERYDFELPGPLARYVAEKGSVCLDGVSLTVNDAGADHFSVCIIPHTQAVTTLGALAVGQAVNLEVDLVARYLERMRNTVDK